VPKSFRLVLSVLVTCVIAATGLALTYGATAPRIEEQKRLAEQRSLEAVMPGATFETAGEADPLVAAAETAAAPVDFVALYRAFSDGQQVGWALRLASRGYAGPMQLVIGLDTSGSVTGVSILSMNETPGLGTKVKSEAWFIEQAGELQPGFTDADVRGTMDAISGATRSSNGVRNGVAAAGRIYLEVLAGEEGEAR
jgi:electron transport complex protein RnfG